MQTAARARYQAARLRGGRRDHDKHLLVDDAQDLTPTGLEFAIQERQSSGTVTIAYSQYQKTGIWRGVDPGSFWEFLEEYQTYSYDGVGQHTLGIEFRSSSSLSDFLTNLARSPAFQGLEAREARTIRPPRDIPQLRRFRDRPDLLQGLVKSIRARHVDGEEVQHIAVFFRQVTTMDQCRLSLKEGAIPCTVLGAPRQAWDQDTRRVVGLFKLLLNQHDLQGFSDAAAMCTPTGWKELDSPTAAALVAASLEEDCDLVEAAHGFIRTLNPRSPVRMALERAIHGFDTLQNRQEMGVEDPPVRRLCVSAYVWLREGEDHIPVHGDPFLRTYRRAE